MSYNGTIGTGTTARGVISPLGEYDSFNTTLISGLTYSVAAKGASSGNGTLGDPNLALYDSAGNRLLFNDDLSGTNRDAQLTFKIAAGATAAYTLVVGEQGNNATGSYALTVSAGPCSRSHAQAAGGGTGVKV